MEKRTWETRENSVFKTLSSTDFFGENKKAGQHVRTMFGDRSSVHSVDHPGDNPVLQRERICENNHDEVIRNARRYIHENFSRKISIDEIARHCFMSQYHFSRVFKMYTSVSPHQYLLQLRLRHAEKLTKYTDLPITDICFISGFSSLDYFSTAFTKKYKLSPKKFRLLKQAELQQ